MNTVSNEDITVYSVPSQPGTSKQMHKGQSYILCFVQATRPQATATVDFLILELNNSVVLLFVVSRNLLQNVKLL